MNILSKNILVATTTHKTNCHSWIRQLFFFSLIWKLKKTKWISRSFVIGCYLYPCPDFEVKLNLNIIWCLYLLLQIVWETLYSLNGSYVRTKHISCYLSDGHWNKSMGNILQSFRFCLRKSETWCSSSPLFPAINDQSVE